MFTGSRQLILHFWFVLLNGVSAHATLAELCGRGNWRLQAAHFMQRWRNVQQKETRFPSDTRCFTTPLTRTPPHTERSLIVLLNYFTSTRETHESVMCMTQTIYNPKGKEWHCKLEEVQGRRVATTPQTRRSLWTSDSLPAFWQQWNLTIDVMKRTPSTACNKPLVRDSRELSRLSSRRAVRVLRCFIVALLSSQSGRWHLASTRLALFCSCSGLLSTQKRNFFYSKWPELKAEIFQTILLDMSGCTLPIALLCLLRFGFHPFRHPVEFDKTFLWPWPWNGPAMFWLADMLNFYPKRDF